VGPLPDEIPLELCERSEDVEDELAATGRGVGLLLQGAEADASLLQLFDRVDEVGEGAAESVQPPDNESVARAQVRERLGQTRPVGDRARDGVGVELM
jgi:hypothetical protein